MLDQTIGNIISKKTGKSCQVLSSNSVSGGSINQAKKLKTNCGDFFVKLNSANRFPGMFEAETKGLNLLRSANELFIPQVIAFGEENEEQYLLMEYIEAKRTISNFWEDFGQSLARLHKHSNSYFGLDHDNYIGSLPQANDQKESWADFFIEMRLKPQIKMARNMGLLSQSHVSHFDGLFKELPSLFPNEPPALLHGDLWSGNYMISPEGKACIMDPAVYYGHREMDLGMSQLFGGFQQDFYTHYNEEYPLENGWTKRLDICNLYPLLVHVNLFGRGYVSQVESVIKKY